MKRLQSEGYMAQKQAEVLTKEDEDILWEKGILGSENPQSLLNSVIFFYNGSTSLYAVEESTASYNHTHVTLK